MPPTSSSRQPRDEPAPGDRPAPDDPAEDGFVKRNPGAPAGFFEYEAAGLRWLGMARATGGPPVVGVLAVEPGVITLKRLAPVPPTPAPAEPQGREHAALHASGAATFGALPPEWTGTAWIGRQVLPPAVDPTARWGAFYAETRVAPFAASAAEAGNLSASGRRTIDRVCERLAAGLFDDDLPPARLHGDLWAGNVVFTKRGGTVIDPSAHGGHGLTDLAMLELFGLSHLDRMTAAYAEAAGPSALVPRWRSLIGLHQLYPLLVHATSHGPSYGAEAAQVARRYG